MTDLQKATAALHALANLAWASGSQDGHLARMNAKRKIAAAEKRVLAAFAEAYAPDPRLASLTPAMVDLLAKAFAASGEDVKIADGGGNPYNRRTVRMAEEAAWDALRDAAREHIREQARQALAEQGVGT